jgi:hypothetical protein
LRTVLLNSILSIVAASTIGVAVGLGCAWHSEIRAAEREKLDGKRIESRLEEPPEREPWLRVDIVDKSPPTRLHLCLFFGAWGGLVGGLLAAGGQWEATLKWGLLGGVIWLFIEQAAVGMMANRGFSSPWEPRPILISFVSFLAASAAAAYTSVEDKKGPRKRLREPE